MNTKIKQQAQKINQELLKHHDVIKYNHYFNLIKNDAYLIQLEQKIKQLQKDIINSIIDSQEQKDLIHLKEKLYLEYDENPLVINYNYYREKVQCLLKEVETILK